MYSVLIQNLDYSDCERQGSVTGITNSDAPGVAYLSVVN